MHDIGKFIAGFRRFQQDYFCADTELFTRLKEGQYPKVLVIGCCDSRVDPAILTGCSPGDIFVVRNVGNLVPPYEPDSAHHGVSAALEFAVQHLQVEHIIILAHSQCGGIQALMSRGGACGAGGEFIDRWVGIAEPARQQVLAELAGRSPEIQQRACEQAAALVSLENLMSFPWVRERVTDGRLALHAWYFELESGELMGYLTETGCFEPLVPKCLIDG